MRIELETERLRLRPFREDDAEAMFYGWANDPEVTKYLTWDVHESIDVTRYVLKMWVDEYEQPDRINFAIELKDSGELIGGIDVVRYVDGIPEIGYVLSKKHWGRGYMTEACKCVLKFLFSKGFPEVMITAQCENKGSNRVIQKCGGIYQGTGDFYIELKNDTVSRNIYIVKAG